VFFWIYDIPSERLALLIAGAFAAFLWVGAIVFRPVLCLFVRSRSGTNDIVGYIFSCFGVFYPVYLLPFSPSCGGVGLPVPEGMSDVYRRPRVLREFPPSDVFPESES
jgi:hypothetical protein